MRESLIEKKDRKRIAAAGGRMLKFVSPGLVGVPDDIVLRPVPPEHQPLVAQYFRFAEYKKPGEEPKPHQVRRHNELRAMGFTVDVIDQPTENP